MTARSARLSMAFSNIGHFFSHLLMLLYPTVVLALEGRWGLTYGELLSLSIPGYVLFGAAALPAGWLGDRWSAEHMMVLYFVGTGAAAVLTGFADGPLGLALGLSAIGLFGSISVNTTEGGGGAIATTAYTMASGLAIGTLSGITTAINNLATARAANGAAQSRLGFAAEVLTVNKSNLEAANSRIMDVDVAEESTQLARWNILVQSCTAMLSQANQSAQSALRLLQ